MDISGLILSIVEEESLKERANTLIKSLPLLVEKVQTAPLIAEVSPKVLTILADLAKSNDEVSKWISLTLVALLSPRIDLIRQKSSTQVFLNQIYKITKSSTPTDRLYPIAVKAWESILLTVSATADSIPDTAHLISLGLTSIVNQIKLILGQVVKTLPKAFTSCNSAKDQKQLCFVLQATLKAVDRYPSSLKTIISKKVTGKGSKKDRLVSEIETAIGAFSGNSRLVELLLTFLSKIFMIKERRAVAYST